MELKFSKKIIELVGKKKEYTTFTVDMESLYNNQKITFSTSCSCTSISSMMQVKDKWIPNGNVFKKGIYRLSGSIKKSTIGNHTAFISVIVEGKVVNKLTIKYKVT